MKMNTLFSKKIAASRIKIFFVLALFAGFANAQVTSALWGVNGNAWNPPNSVLRDFTDVGYKNGNEPIPDWPVAHSVTDFGAIPDDGIDDSQAFIDAIDACPDNHAVLVPKGTFTILQKVVVNNDYVCLRGEDMYESIIFFPKYYGEVYINEAGFDAGSTPVYDKFFQLVGGTGKSIENLTFKFREQRLKGVWEYEGAGFLDYQYVSDSWVRNVVFLNYSSGFTFSGTRCSFINLIFDQFNGRCGTDDVSTQALDAYGSVLVRNCSYSLFHNISIAGGVLQPIDLNENNHHNVYSEYRGSERLNRAIGYHGGSSTYDLYTDMNKGVVTPKTHPSRGDETYWNVDDDDYQYGKVTEEVYNSDNGLVFVGYGDDFAAKTDDPATWYEPADYGVMTPSNIYLAQLEYFSEPLPEPFPRTAPSRYEGDVFGVVPDDDTKVDNEWYYRFDLSDTNLPAVAHARLRVHLDNRRVGTPPYTFHAWTVAEDAWSEDTMTTEKKPALGSELDTRYFAHADDNRVLEFDVTSFVQSQLVGGDGVVSLALNITADGNPGTPSLWSAEKGTKPELIIERVADPVPGPPSAPQNIGTTPLLGNILLDWEDHPESNVTYTVYRNPYKVTESKDGPPSITWGYGEYIDNGLVSSDIADIQSSMNWRAGQMYHGVVYKYKIAAVDNHGYESPRSKEIYAATLHPSNDPPGFDAAPRLATAITQLPYSEPLANVSSDPESDPLYFHIISGPDWLNISSNGVLSGTPELSDVGTNTFTAQVTAIGGSEQKTLSIVVELPVDDPAGAPAAPTGLGATPGNRSVSLSWGDNTEADLYGYNLFRSTTPGSYGSEPLALVLNNFYADNTVANGTTYYYKITAIDSSANESTDSSEVFATPEDITPPAAPTGLEAIADEGSVTLDWDDNGENDWVGYNLYRSTTPGSYGVAWVSDLASSDYVDNSVTNGTTYYYQVTAVDTADNESDASAEVSATPEVNTNTATLWQGGATDNIWDASRWSAGLPDNPRILGTIGSDALWSSSTATLTDYYLDITGGTLLGSGFTIFFTFTGGEQTFNGGSLSTTATLQFNGGATGTVNHASSRITAGRFFVENAAFILDNGTLVADQLFFKGSATFTMNGGKVTATSGNALFGANSFFGGGSAFLNGGSLTAGNLDFASPNFDLTLGGTNIGSAEFTAGFGGAGHNDTYIDIDWLPGSKMELIVAGADWASIWNDGRMTYNGNDYTTLGNWSAVTASDGLAPGVQFIYSPETETLSLIVPEVAPAAPTGLTAETRDGMVLLGWTDNYESDLDSYNVYRSTVSGSYHQVLTNLTESAYSDSTVVNGTRYYYTVTAVDADANESTPSAEVTALPKALSDATLFGSDFDGLGSFTQSPSVSSNESWSEKTGSVQYRSQDTGTLNSSFLREFQLDRESGRSYIIEGVVLLSSGYADDNNRVGLYLFGDSAVIPNQSEAGAVGLIFNTDDGSAAGSPGTDAADNISLQTGIDGGALSDVVRRDQTTPYAQDLFGTEITLGAEFRFYQDGADERISIDAYMVAAGITNTIPTVDVLAADYTGDWFGFVTRARVRNYAGPGGTPEGRSLPWVMDYKKFSVNATSEQPEPAGYNQWAAAQGLEAGTAEDDADGDGMNNFYEYAMGGEPTNAASMGSLPVFSKQGVGFIYVHPQRSDDTNLTYLVETTTNLIFGEWTSQGVVAVGTNITGGELNFVTNDVETIEDERFIRLTIEQ